ncbi:MAG: hypothetical protein M3Y29_02960, partial [Chloroflexota bacterium]|nr:hypothetical protein [Chloroflexota bacterium]
LLLTAVVAAATLLPAATIRITPRSVPIDPVSYEIRTDDPERVDGTVSATAIVTATGTYAIQAAATGTVVFLNWNFVPVEVPAGTLVAAGEQAFETTADVVVPEGALTGEGTIQAGEQAVGVVAAAIGPDANVAAGAIDQVLSEQTARRLRGFPNNPQRLVTNPEPTAGGADTTGPEITQSDVDAALSTLREALAAAATDELEGTDAGLYADPPEPPAPTIAGVDGLVGTRDQEQVEISGELAYDRLTADPAAVQRQARERFAADDTVVPEGHELLADTIEVELGDVRRDGDALVVAAVVRGRSAPQVDRDEILDRVTGLGADEARATLAHIGEASVELWPGWVATIPDSDWRVEVVVTGVDES